jgi:serine/threonine protein kinase
MVLHCDLAARNVVLSVDLVAKLCDFGMAKFFGQIVSRGQSSRQVSGERKRE